MNAVACCTVSKQKVLSANYLVSNMTLDGEQPAVHITWKLKEMQAIHNINAYGSRVPYNTSMVRDVYL